MLTNNAGYQICEESLQQRNQINWKILARHGHISKIRPAILGTG